MTYPTITVEQLGQRCQTDSAIALIDVRMPVEFREVHASLARNVPLDRLDPATLMESHQSAETGSLYVICASGARAKQACEKITAAGYQDVVLVEGGTEAWQAAGLPVVRGKKAMSLERQVRIAAGFLVLLGVGLSYVHPAWIGISAFVGAGLMFAGMTDWCGMGMLLSRMPWNQVKGACEKGQCGVT